MESLTDAPPAHEKSLHLGPKVRRELAEKEDRIICAGDVGTELYFVAVGEASIFLCLGFVATGRSPLKALRPLELDQALGSGILR